MSDARYAIRHYGSGLWDVIDQQAGDLQPLSGEYMAKMSLEECERVVRLMNELEKRFQPDAGPSF
ncbi:hypothetical protein [Aureimonas sp. Leaf324]|uniref:hypothetical protein n=1 Tax=Aureimonas sp. Leaf324 TaxID=1736336 RepID=UPI0006F496FD|nr:hypothetical protein [Aureimonas sp. Leaf324]KQQ81926.1 hypothetical protein ASF65_07680 [Aureimonas sp. Leaf324]